MLITMYIIVGIVEGLILAKMFKAVGLELTPSIWTICFSMGLTIILLPMFALMDWFSKLRR